MSSERKSGDFRWIEYVDMSFRIKDLKNGFSTVWVTTKGYDIYIALFAYEFPFRFEEDWNIPLKSDSSWIIKGYVIKTEHVDLLIDKIESYVIEWDIWGDKHGTYIEPEVWYKASD